MASERVAGHGELNPKWRGTLGSVARAHECDGAGLVWREGGLHSSKELKTSCGCRAHGRMTLSEVISKSTWQQLDISDYLGIMFNVRHDLNGKSSRCRG